MEASAVTPAAEAEGYDGQAEATRLTDELFEWSGYVHVGTSADVCVDKLNGKCANYKHFHAWVCVPNSFQARDIDEKARAAQSRKTLALRDAGKPDHPDPKRREPSDSYVTLEAALATVADEPEELENVIQGIVDSIMAKLIPEIVGEMAADERFVLQSQHAEEMQRLAAMDPDERPTEEYEQLSHILADYGEELQRRMDDRREREAVALRHQGVDEILNIERRRRIKTLGQEVYVNYYYMWCMYACCFDPVEEAFPSVRRFKTPEHLRTQPPEVLAAVSQKISDLENRTTQRGDAAGN